MSNKKLSSEDIESAKLAYYQITGEDYFSEPDSIQNYIIREIKPVYNHTSDELKKAAKDNLDSLLNEDISLASYYSSLNDKGYKEAVGKVTALEQLELRLGQDLKEPTNFQEAKNMADLSYLVELQSRQQTYDSGSDEWNKLQEAINQGALDFQSFDDIRYIQYSGSDIYRASYTQSNLMKEYLESNDIPLYVEADEEDASQLEHNKVFLNTGTALQHFEQPMMLDEKMYGNASTGSLGSYGLYELDSDTFRTDRSFKAGAHDWLNGMTAMLSIAFPPFAPIIQGANQFIQTGDLGESVKSTVTGFVEGDIAEVSNEKIEEAFKAGDVDISKLPEPAKKTILDTTRATISGKSGSEEFKKESAKALIKSGMDFGDADFSNIDFNAPDWLKQIGDSVVATGEKTVEVIEDVFKPPAEFVAETFEPVVDFADERLDVFGEQYVDPTLKALKQKGQDIIDPIDQRLDVFGEQYVDPTLKSIGEFGQDIIDPLDDFIDYIDSPLGDLLKKGIGSLDLSLSGVGMGKQEEEEEEELLATETEELFADDLFKFDTEIKSTQRMLNPRRNLRKYG